MFPHTTHLRRVVLGVVAASLLTATACLDDSPVAPANSAVQLRISAQVSGANDWAIGVRVYYFQNDEDEIDLEVTPAVIRVPRGESVTQPVTVDVLPCLQDPDRSIGEEGPTRCELRVELQLFDEEGVVLSEQTNFAVVSTPGEVVEVESFVLAAGDLYFSEDGGPTSFAAFSGFVGLGLPQTRFFDIIATTNREVGPLTFTVSYIHGAGWLSAFMDVEGAVHVRPTTTNLPPGTYDAVVQATSTRGFTPAELFVRYTVTVE